MQLNQAGFLDCCGSYIGGGNLDGIKGGCCHQKICGLTARGWMVHSIVGWALAVLGFVLFWTAAA